MSTREEIMYLEERLRQAELGPDPAFFEEHLADDVVLDGMQLKTRVVEAHRPVSGKGQKLRRSTWNTARSWSTVQLSC